MVRKFLSIFSKEISGLHEAAYLLGFFALLSQVLALIRDRLLAHIFGASHALDIYYAGFRIPDFIFVSVASMVSISVLIPFLIDRLETDPGSARRFLSNVFSAFFFLIMTVAIVAFFFTPYLLRLFFPTFKHDFGTLVSVTRILLLSPIFLGFSNFLASITQVYKRFFIYALSPIVYNLGIILGIVFLLPRFGIQGLAWGVALGAFLHFFIQVPFVVNKSLFPRLSWRIDFAYIRQVALLSLPRTLTISSNEICEFFLVSFASFLSGGSISVFNFSFNLQSVPLSIIGVSYSLAAFPTLTRLYTSGNNKKFVDHMVTTTQHIIFWSIPVMVLFVVLRAQIVRVILGSGQFSWSDTRLTAASLALFIISIIPQSLVVLFVRAYYSRGNTKKPLLMNLFSSLLIIALSYVLVIFYNHHEFFRFFIQSMFRIEDLPGGAVLMLPLAFSIGVTVNLIIHWIAFHLDFPEFSGPVFRTFWQSLGASVIMGFVSYELLNLFDNFFDLNTFWGIFLQGFLSGMIGITIAIVLLSLLKNREIRSIWRTLHHKIWKAKVIGPDPNAF
ncbi:murein biosynthesis integral membrane protein MurJ [Candidatus Parcubacteria bacterium]|nr:murein biosynthesis integral membrane protein MurJ [Candidatus Parcubacteria bacterium]